MVFILILPGLFIVEANTPLMVDSRNYTEKNFSFQRLISLSALVVKQ